MTIDLGKKKATRVKIEGTEGLKRRRNLGPVSARLRDQWWSPDCALVQLITRCHRGGRN